MEEGFWARAGLLRARVSAAKHKAALGDVLIAQTCIDHGVPLLTSDRDFAAFVGIGGLALA